MDDEIHKSFEEGKGRLIHGWIESYAELDKNASAQIILRLPLPSLNCSHCVLSLSRNTRFAFGGEEAYAVNPHLIEIRSIEIKDEGWTAKGVGQIETVKCPHCGMIYDAILRAVPIYCSSFECPKCKKTEKLTYKINRIETAFHQFDFEVSILCEGCNKKRTLRRIIKSILDVIKISVGPKGITVEKNKY